jgi:Phosphate-induced protein 1 conserved region
LQSIVEGSGMPLSMKGLYLVIASEDVLETSGYCDQYCAWHAAGRAHGVLVSLAYIGTPISCPACMPQTVGPNGDGPADPITNAVAHVLSEMLTDPHTDSWYAIPLTPISKHTDT